MIEILSYPFMQRALIAALLTGLIAPAIGTYVVQRRLSLLGDGLGHVALAGVGLALLTGTAPIPLAVVACIVGAVVVEILRQRGKASGDVGLAMLVLRRPRRRRLPLRHFRRWRRRPGAVSLRLPDHGDAETTLILIAVLAIVILVITLGLAPQLYAVSTDEEFARTQGLRVRLYHIAVVSLAAVTVALAMRTVGLLLVSALDGGSGSCRAQPGTRFHRGLDLCHRHRRCHSGRRRGSLLLRERRTRCIHRLAGHRRFHAELADSPI